LKAIPVESSLRISPSSPSSQFGTKAWLLLEFSFSLDEDFVELLLDLPLRELEEFVAVSFPLEEDSSSQSSQMDEEESSSCGAKLLSSSPQATRNAKDKRAKGRSLLVICCPPVKMR
jgi:hypothetical protein